MKTVIETITPFIAKIYLKANTDNRPLRPSHVKTLAYDMKNGHWQVTHQGIAFDDTGRLIDGQHRLHAIVEAGVPVEMSVTRGCSASAFSILDRGANRSASDILRWNRRVTDVVNFALSIAYGNQTSQTVSRIKLMEGSVLVQNCELLLSYCPTCKPIMSTAAVKLAACVQMSLKASEGEFGFILSQYKALIFEQYDEMTKCSQSFNRQSRDKRMFREELFCRAMIAFNQIESNTIYVRLTPEIMAQKYEIVRNIVKKHIGNES